MPKSSYILLSAANVDYLGLLNFTRKVQIFTTVRRKLVLLKIKMSAVTMEWCLILAASTGLLYCGELNLNGGKDLLVNTAEEKWDHWESIKPRLDSVSTTPCYFILQPLSVLLPYEEPSKFQSTPAVKNSFSETDIGLFARLSYSKQQRKHIATGSFKTAVKVRL